MIFSLSSETSWRIGSMPKYLRLNDSNVALLDYFQIPADIARLALADHDEQKRRHENMIGTPVDQNDIVIGAELAAQIGCRHHAAAAAA